MTLSGCMRYVMTYNPAPRRGCKPILGQDRLIIQKLDQKKPLRIENTLSETSNKVIPFINQMRLLAERQCH
ncbi:MAG TPA: hypothetical protein VIJ57_02315, partial [Hanamia sp.]